ncbi:hypothetical protein FHT93_004310 [Rhizobium sp. BK379]|nr:hypothetical protein [Rhizobium sp. BK379]
MESEGRGLPSSAVTGVDCQLLLAQAGDYAAPAAAGGEGDHQDGPVADVAQVAATAGRQQLRQHVTGDCLGALALSRPRHGAHGETNG